MCAFACACLCERGHATWKAETRLGVAKGSAGGDAPRFRVAETAEPHRNGGAAAAPFHRRFSAWETNGFCVAETISFRFAPAPFSLVRRREWGAGEGTLVPPPPAASSSSRRPSRPGATRMSRQAGGMPKFGGRVGRVVCAASYFGRERLHNGNINNHY